MFDFLKSIKAIVIRDGRNDSWSVNDTTTFTTTNTVFPINIKDFVIWTP